MHHLITEVREPLWASIKNLTKGEVPPRARLMRSLEEEILEATNKDSNQNLRGDVYVAYHSVGLLEATIPNLVEIRVDIINPVQLEVKGPSTIKRKYGDKLTLKNTLIWVDRGHAKGVRTRILTCGHGGELITAPSNQVLIDTKIENFLAVYDAAKKNGRYPLCGNI